MSEQRRDSITDIPGVLVGHATKPGPATGCTVVWSQTPAVVGISIAGGAPGSRETALCDPVRYVERVDAILFAGGSAFGLAAADGVMRYLAEKDAGFQTAQRRIPIVPSAVIYDLHVGDPHAAPTAADGYAAAAGATSGPVEQGRVGAGTGALVGKVCGPGFAVPGGVGSARVSIPGGAMVGALAVVNAFGDVMDPETAKIVAGARTENGEFLDTGRYLLSGNRPCAGFSQNTTLGVVATNCRLTKVEATRVAQMAQNGIARTIVPSGTVYDGDIVFALSSGSVEADATVIGMAATCALTRAILRAVQAAGS